MSRSIPKPITRPVPQARNQARTQINSNSCCADETIAINKECLDCCLRYTSYIRAAIRQEKTSLLRKIIGTKGWEGRLGASWIESYSRITYEFYTSEKKYDELKYLVKNEFINISQVQKLYDMAINRGDFDIIKILLKYGKINDSLKINDQDILSVLLRVGLKSIQNSSKNMTKRVRYATNYIYKNKDRDLDDLSPVISSLVEKLRNLKLKIF